MNRLFRPIVDDIAEYKPGKNPEKPGVIKLASNENPFGPSPKALQAIKNTVEKLQTYPDQKSISLRAALSKKLRVDEASIIIGNGSDDIMQIAGATFISPGDEIIIPKNSFGVYTLVTKIFEGVPVFVDLKDYKMDLDAMAQAISPRTKLIFLTNPHNPTGTYFGKDALLSFLQKVPENVLVILDEAYGEFAEAPDFPRSIDEIILGRKNILILRTFSKYYGLAGLRVGYGITAPELVSAMLKVKMPFNVNRLAQAGAATALEDKGFLEKTLKNNSEGKKQLYEGLGALGLTYNKTESNFILVEANKPADEIFLKMMAEGIIIRPLTSFGIPNAIRLSIGTKDQNKKMLEALKKAL